MIQYYIHRCMWPLVRLVLWIRQLIYWRRKVLVCNLSNFVFLLPRLEFCCLTLGEAASTCYLAFKVNFEPCDTSGSFTCPVYSTDTWDLGLKSHPNDLVRLDTCGLIPICFVSTFLMCVVFCIFHKVMKYQQSCCQFGNMTHYENFEYFTKSVPRSNALE